MGDRETCIKFYNQAVAAVNDKSLATNAQTAFQLFASACQVDPTYWQAHYQMGNNTGDLKQPRAAVAHYRKALQCEMTPADKSKVLCNLGWRLYELGHIEESLDALQQSLDIDDKCVATWLNMSQAHGILGQNATALECARRCYELAPGEPTSAICMAFAHLFAGQYAEGFKYFEKRFEWRLHSFLQYPYPKWLGEEDKTVFLVADQGLGDTLSFSRFVHMAAKRARYIHAYIQPELMRLFMHAFTGLDNVNLLPFGASFPQADAWSTFVSLPFALGLTDEQIINAKHIEVPRVSLPTSWMVPDTRLHVGIAWAGSAVNDIDKHRSIPLHHFLELYRVPGIQLYSLQVDNEHREDANNQGAVALVRNLAPYIRDITDTIALLKDLDLLIVCESAQAHIASLVGKETWIAYSYLGNDYRIGHRGENMLWTPNTTVFQQGPDQRWEPVFDKIVGALKAKLGALAGD